MYRFGQKRRYLRGRSDAGTRHSSKQKLYGDDSCPSQPQSQKGIGGLLLEFWIGAGKSSHSCGKLHYFYHDFVCEDKE